MKREAEAPSEDGLTPALRGFRGMLVGRLVEKDIERGTFTITVDAVPRVWNNNKAPNPKTIHWQEGRRPKVCLAKCWTLWSLPELARRLSLEH